MENNNPWSLNQPVYLLCPPFGVSNRFKNNVLMEKFNEEYDHTRAFQQFYKLYQKLVEKGALVYLLDHDKNLQDQIFTANAAIILKNNPKVAIISKFTSIPRRGESRIAQRFLENLGYLVAPCPFRFEGKADLLWIKDKTYIGGFGIRSTQEAFSWIRGTFGIEITEVKLTNARNYHLDCSVFNLSREKLLIVTSDFSFQEIRNLEAYVDIVDVPEKYKYCGWTNLERIGDTVFHSPDSLESSKALSKLLEKHDTNLELIDLTEFEKSGASLSCLLLPLN